MLLVAFCAGIVIAPALYHSAHPHGFGTGDSDGVVRIGDARSTHAPVCPMCQLHIGHTGACGLLARSGELTAEVPTLVLLRCCRVLHIKTKQQHISTLS